MSGSYLSQGYLSKSESNSSSGVRTHLLRFYSPSLEPLHHKDTSWPREVVSIRVSSMGQVEQFSHLLYFKPLNCMQTNDSY